MSGRAVTNLDDWLRGSGEMLFTIDETAQIFRRTPRTIFSWMEKGLLPFVKIEYTTRIRASDLEATLKRFTVRKGKK